MPPDANPVPDWPDPSATAEAVRHALASIATHAWRARGRMVDPTSGEVREDMKRLNRSVEGIVESLRALGVEIKDHTGQSFDYGLPLKVISTQPTAGIVKEQVVETLRPTVYWRQQIIQPGEVVIATPAGPSPNEQNNH